MLSDGSATSFLYTTNNGAWLDFPLFFFFFSPLNRVPKVVSSLWEEPISIINGEYSRRELFFKPPDRIVEEQDEEEEHESQLYVEYNY